MGGHLADRGGGRTDGGRDLGETDVVLRQAIQRALVDQPHFVVEGAEEQIRLVQGLHRRLAQIPEAMQVGQQAERVLVGRIWHPVPQLQELDDEMDIEQSPGTQLDAAPGVTLRFLNQPLSHVVHRGAQDVGPEMRTALQDQGLQRLRGASTEGRFTGDRSCLEERLHLPDLRRVAKVVHEPFDRHDQVPLSPRGTEPQVDAIQLAITAQAGEIADDPLKPDPGERAQRGRSRSRLIHKDQIEIGAVVHLAVTEASQPQRGQTQPGRSRATRPSEPLAGQPHGHLQRRLRKVGQTFQDLAQGRLPVDVADGEGRESLLVAAPQLRCPRARVALVPQDSSQRPEVIGSRRGADDAPAVLEGPEDVGPADEDAGQKIASPEKVHRRSEDFPV